MKKLVISMKSTDNIFKDFKQEAKKIKAGKSSKNTHYEMAFENQKDFNKFIKNISILMAILNSKPHSVYQLAKVADRDLSNIKKVVAFFEEIGAVKIKEEKVSGRIVKRPIVDYDRVEFNLNAV